MLRLRMLAVGIFWAIVWLHPVHASSGEPSREALWHDALTGNAALEPADGVLGRATYRVLTVPLDRRAEQIPLSLERVRWLPRMLNAPPIIVNIPQFRLFAFRTEHDFAQDILQRDRRRAG